jgi:hypothetical protein
LPDKSVSEISPLWARNSSNALRCGVKRLAIV